MDIHIQQYAHPEVNLQSHFKKIKGKLGISYIARSFLQNYIFKVIIFELRFNIATALQNGLL